jgi:hypothetical protein
MKTDKKEEKEKTVKVNFSNVCGKMSLKVKGPKAIDQSLKLMEVFDESCKELRKREVKRDEY